MHNSHFHFAIFVPLSLFVGPEPDQCLFYTNFVMLLIFGLLGSIVCLPSTCTELLQIRHMTVPTKQVLPPAKEKFTKPQLI